MQVKFYSGPSRAAVGHDGSMQLAAFTVEQVANGVRTLDCICGFGFAISEDNQVMVFERKYAADGGEVVDFATGERQRPWG